LLSVPLPDDPYMGYELVYETQRPVFGLGTEQFWLYRPLKHNTPANEQSLPENP
jgi:hypothetical protein